MTALNVLVEAAKLVEYDEDLSINRRKSITLAADEQMRRIKPGFRVVQATKGNNRSIVRYDPNEVRRGTRETHNILEKNRRADMKNYFQKLKANLPKLRDMVKASNVSILTEAVKHIAELTATDEQFHGESARLRKCQICLEERIKMLKEDIRRQHFCAQLFVQVQEEKRRVLETSSSPKMMSVETQANESDIIAELPVNDKDHNGTKCNRNCLSDLRNDFSQNVQSSSERLSTLMNSKSSPAKGNFPGIENSPKSVQPLERLGFYSVDKVPPEIERLSPPNHCTSKYNSINSLSRKRKLAENEDTDSDNELKIIIEDE